MVVYRYQIWYLINIVTFLGICYRNKEEKVFNKCLIGLYRNIIRVEEMCGSRIKLERPERGFRFNKDMEFVLIKVFDFVQNYATFFQMFLCSVWFVLGPYISWKGRSRDHKQLCCFNLYLIAAVVVIHSWEKIDLVILVCVLMCNLCLLALKFLVCW